MKAHRTHKCSGFQSSRYIRLRDTFFREMERYCVKWIISFRILRAFSFMAKSHEYRYIYCGIFTQLESLCFLRMTLQNVVLSNAQWNVSKRLEKHIRKSSFFCEMPFILCFSHVNASVQLAALTLRAERVRPHSFNNFPLEIMFSLNSEALNFYREPILKFDMSRVLND